MHDSTPSVAAAVMSDRSRLARQLTLHGLLLVLWLAAFLSARLLEYAPHASLWFPPAAVTFAGVLVLGWRALPALLVACFIATRLTYAFPLSPTQLLASGLSFAIVHCTAFGLLAAAVRWVLARPDSAGSLLRPVAVFLLGGSVAALLSAIGGAVGLRMSGMIAPVEVGALIVPWMIGDYAGLVSLGPLLALLLRQVAGQLGVAHSLGRLRLDPPGDATRRLPALWPKLGILLGVTAGVLAAGAWLPEQPPILFTLFLAIVVQMWIVHSQPALHSLCSIAAFSLTLVVLTALLELGPHALTLQFAMIALAANSYFGLAVPELYADNARLRRLTMTDPLTGAWSRAFFIEQARNGIQRAERSGDPAALVMIDLDELKTINDVHGHAAGDEALRLLVDHCRRPLAAGQVIGRLSGDEFCVFLPGADTLEAMRCVARMRQSLEQIAPERSAHPVRASFGIAVMDSPGESYESLLSRADKAMYEAKRASRGSRPDGGEPRRRYR
jgi:diguanylate cyclase (GGDEF)-like protein